MKWTNKDIQYLTDNIELQTNSELATNLNRTYRSIGVKLNKMGLVRTKETVLRIRNLRNTDGSNNPNWKNGISSNNYHYKLLQKQRYPEKVKARDIVRDALRNGTITKKPCVICGDVNSHAHHDDYTKPLDVKWVCRKHHKEIHKGLH